MIEGFIAKPYFDEEDNFDIMASTRLDVGDSVEYIDWYDKYVGDNLYKNIQYKHHITGEILGAVETYFVTEEVWNGLLDYFKNSDA
ncbi:hypothetical protein [Paenibacillus radicis (ex Gao et al. 2016)]|uniref:hypothetical protein n=1 Tax=Paenibacillus radicis (ex Gao et al. 2016) TaxID=1737354 RepID=UPI0016674823|nr:hypothetical protein [Paenibacillus radicis (ex Gao et al. 2016)]